MLEYMPRRHEYVSEIIMGARVEDNRIVFFGASDLIEGM